MGDEMSWGLALPLSVASDTWLTAGKRNVPRDVQIDPIGFI